MVGDELHSGTGRGGWKRRQPGLGGGFDMRTNCRPAAQAPEHSESSDLRSEPLPPTAYSLSYAPRRRIPTTATAIANSIPVAGSGKVPGGGGGGRFTIMNS